MKIHPQLLKLYCLQANKQTNKWGENSTAPCYSVCMNFFRAWLKHELSHCLAILCLFLISWAYLLTTESLDTFTVRCPACRPATSSHRLSRVQQTRYDEAATKPRRSTLHSRRDGDAGWLPLIHQFIHPFIHEYSAASSLHNTRTLRALRGRWACWFQSYNGTNALFAHDDCSAAEGLLAEPTPTIYHVDHVSAGDVWRFSIMSTGFTRQMRPNNRQTHNLCGLPRKLILYRPL